MICSIKAQALASGRISEVVVANRNSGPAEQNSDLRTLISRGVNAIVVNPSSPSALNSVIAQAAARNIKVVSVDQRPRRRPDATNDQLQYSRIGAEWLFQKLGGRSNVVEVRIAGVPADTDRHAGFQLALRKYPNIKVVKQTFTGWRFAPGGKQMLDILNSGVQVDGMDVGIDYTVVNAFRTAKAARADRGRGQQRVPQAAAHAEGLPRRRGDEPGDDRRRWRVHGDPAPPGPVGAEVGEAEAAAVGRARRRPG